MFVLHLIWIFFKWTLFRSDYLNANPLKMYYYKLFWNRGKRQVYMCDIFHNKVYATLNHWGTFSLRSMHACVRTSTNILTQLMKSQRESPIEKQVNLVGSVKHTQRAPWYHGNLVAVALEHFRHDGLLPFAMLVDPEMLN